MKAAGQEPAARNWPKRQYRADLDGMRAVAVLSVVVFHLEHSLLPGGFVGVDVFFVLSGFFITQLLLNDLSQSTFSLTRFYDRRIRRLFPALLLMLAVTALAAAFILMPGEFRRFGRNLMGAVLSLSNFVFWADSDYFSPDAETYPLLHTWSLAVEEQFYLLYPISLWLLWRFCRGCIGKAMLLVFALSFALSVYASYYAPSAAFYLAPSRAWELAGGALLAMGIFSAPRSWLARQLAYGAGLAMVGASVFLLNSSMVFPGFTAVMPCGGTMLVVWAGLNAPEGEPRAGLDRLLTAQPMVWVGLISYSLYLWHWPVIVLSHNLSITHPGAMTHLALVPVMFLIAFLSWRYVEQPFRVARHVWPTRRQRFTYAGAAVAALAISGGGVMAANGYPHRLPQIAIALDGAEMDVSPLRADCHAYGFVPGTRRDWCSFGPETGAPVYVYADSHGAEIGYALTERAEGLGLRVVPLTASACPPVVGYADAERLNCRLDNEQTLARLEAAPEGTVILTAHFFRFADEAPGFWTGFEATVSRLEAAGHRVVMVGPVPPDLDGTVPTILARMAYLGYDPHTYAFHVDREKLDRIEAALSGIAGRTGAEFIPLAEYLCGARDHCAGLNHGTVIYFDNHHLSVAMARRIVQDRILAGAAPPA